MSDRDSLAIVSVEPASGSTLAEGVFVRVEAWLAYHFESAATATLAVVVICFEEVNLTCLDAGGLAERLCSMRPENQALFMAGCTDDASILKLITQASLTRKVRETVERMNAQGK